MRMPAFRVIADSPAAAVLGALLILVILWEAFETIVLPRRVTRRFRFAVLFYRITWSLLRMIVARLPRRERELLLKRAADCVGTAVLSQ